MTWVIVIGLSYDFPVDFGDRGWSTSRFSQLPPSAKLSKSQNYVFRVCMGLVGSSWTERISWLLARFHDFERPEHPPRSPAGTQTCTFGTSGSPACPAAESARQDQRSDEQRFVFRKKSQFYTYQGSNIRTAVPLYLVK